MLSASSRAASHFAHTTLKPTPHSSCQQHTFTSPSPSTFPAFVFTHALYHYLLPTSLPRQLPAINPSAHNLSNPPSAVPGPRAWQTPTLTLLHRPSHTNSSAEMSGFKRIIPGNRTRSPDRAHAHDKTPQPANPDAKKPSFFRKPHHTPTTQQHIQASQQPYQTGKAKQPIKFGKPSPQRSSEIDDLTNRVSDMGRNTPVPQSERRYSAPHAPGHLFRLAQLPNSIDINVQGLLEQSLRHVTIKRAGAARYSMVTALNNLRELSVLSGVVDQYLPYALTCWDIAEHLKKKGTNVSNGITWASGLIDENESSTPYHGGFGLEAALVLTLSALCNVRNVIETAGNFGMQNDQALVSQIKSLQVAAGMFDYARDEVTPKAMADFVGNPPPELVPEVSCLLSSLCLCLAQALHVRRAVLSGMSVATLAKLSAGAKNLATEVLTNYGNVTRLGVALTDDVRTLANDMMTLTTGWTLQYLGATTQPNVDSGAKITSLREAITTLKTACNSRIVGNVAALDLDDLEKQLQDAVDSNRVVFQHVIPEAKDLQMPQGRSLVSATVYDAKRIPMAKTAPRK